MSEKNMTKKQKEMIESIKKEWINEIKNLPEISYKSSCLDGGGGRYREIEKKYKERIKRIMEES